MKQIIFEKYTGAGNDFVLIDSRKNEGIALTKDLVISLCDRRFGIGADGVLYILPHDDLDFELKYFNSDGTGGMLCGNGARCTLHYAFQQNLIKSNEAQFSCAGYNYTGSKLDELNYEFQLNEPEFIHDNFTINLLGRRLSGFFTNTGANHFVIDFEKIVEKFNLNQISFEDFNVQLYGSAIRNAKEFAPEGTNVNFIHKSGSDIFIRTFEKGIEAETLACGTGSTAAALYLALKHDSDSPVPLITKSGRTLKVSFKREGRDFKNIRLSGPAEKVFEGIYQL